MTRITIGRMDQDWENTDGTSYYARRGAGEEYGFGATPAEALAHLEAREATTSSRHHHNLDQEVAFLAIGAAGYLQDHPDARLDQHDGYLGLISEVISYAPMLSDAWEKIRPEDFPSVWLYDVTERFGRGWAENLLSSGNISASSLLQSIIKEALDAAQ